jgi:hypothetical protein
MISGYIKGERKKVYVERIVDLDRSKRPMWSCFHGKVQSYTAGVVRV